MNCHQMPGPLKKRAGQFDGFTGATITPRAVIEAVHNALEYAADTPLPGNIGADSMTPMASAARDGLLEQ